jgi:hypothetical protein
MPMYYKNTNKKLKKKKKYLQQYSYIPKFLKTIIILNYNIFISINKNK